MAIAKKSNKFEYATIFYDDEEGFWKLFFFDWKKKKSNFTGEWINYLLALNELAQKEWEVVNAYPVKNIETKEIETEFLLKRKRK